MILKSFRVTEFRSVHDSGWVDAEQITALIGTNESGKTNILLPLWKLNPADEGEIDLKADLPRDRYHTYRSATHKPIFIYAKYSLLQNEQKDLAKISRYNEEELCEVIVSKDFDGNLYCEFPFAVDRRSSEIDKGKEILEACKVTLEAAKETSGKAESDRREKALDIIQSTLTILNNTDIATASLVAAYAELDKFEEDVKSSIACVVMSDAIQKFSAIASESKKPSLAETKDVVAYVYIHMPKYVYYSNYGNLDSQIYLPQVLQNIGKIDLGVKEAAKARTLKTLFKFVQLDPREITNLGTEDNGNLSQEQIAIISDKKKEREILLASASSGFTKSFNEWWKQGNYTFEFQADGNFFRIWVSDSVRPERIELESRSTGLQWFFSFYLVFLVESELHHQNAILLLDEPGVTLHPLAQKDLFMFFENLAINNQMLYTTHSPFMVDSNHLERVRSVYIDEGGKTVVSPDLRATERLRGKNQPQSIYPAHAALGLSVSDTLLINCNPILVEGESDQIYLSALKNLLISKGKISPLKEIVFIPTGGVKGVKATSAILSGVSEIKPPVLLDGDKPGVKMATELKSDFYAADLDKIISVSDYTALPNGEIEDLFPKSKIASIIARFLPRPEEVDEEFDDVVTDDTPVCDQIETFAQTHGISLDKGWKVRLATMVKKEVLKGTNRVISEDDAEFNKIISLFEKMC
ncbi:AAA family ATPase [Paludicola sp. MB14-C6]|uniref:AAA family ATPase n=1 Tax=Paludihabitans sp. MB14-C6 TaxID=3070656 RepID=UPI0027DE6F0B|nr:AAA family ATPase [Paludicola sp. MB14-C6]WMJ24337.1 AAA family ATPase [Paludicola sp. MB14-C6]